MTDYLDPAPAVRRRRPDDPYAERGPQSEPDGSGDRDEDLVEDREPASFVPVRLRTAIEFRQTWWTPVDSLAMAVIGISLFVLFIETVGGSLYLDDLRAQAYALDQPFWSFIMGSNGTHFAPLPRVLDWIQSRVFPLEHGPAVVVTLIIRLLFTVVFWRLLRRIFGPRMHTLLPLVLLVSTPALLPATLWYRQSITIVACTVAMLWAVEAHLRWLMLRQRLALAEVVLATVVGVGFYEKAVAIPVLLVAITVALFARHRGEHRVTSPLVLRATAVSTALSCIVIGIFLVIYRSGPYDQGSSAGLPSVFDVLHLAWDTATRDIVPLLLGGPYQWSFTTLYAGTASLSSAMVVIIMAITGVALLFTGLRRPSPLARGLFFILSWMLPSVGIVALGRFESLQLVLADATRLWIDLVPAFILGGALAVLPWEIGACRTGRLAHEVAKERLDRLAELEREAGSSVPSVRPRRSAPPRPVVPGPGELTVPALATGLVFAMILIGSGVSTVTYVSKWWDNPTGTWLSNMRATVGSAEPYARVLATPLPETVMPSWVSTQLPTSAPLLQLIRPDLRFNDGDGAARAVNSKGSLSPMLPGPIAESAKATLCTAVIPPNSTAWKGVKLDRPAGYVAGAQVEVGVILSDVSRVRVQVLTLDKKRLTPQTFSTEPISSGVHVLHYPVPLNKIITGVYVQTDGVQTGCIVSARVWAPLIAGN